jgi:hypothetical protein
MSHATEIGAPVGMPPWRGNARRFIGWRTNVEVRNHENAHSSITSTGHSGRESLAGVPAKLPGAKRSRNRASNRPGPRRNYSARPIRIRDDLPKPRHRAPCIKPPWFRGSLTQTSPPGAVPTLAWAAWETETRPRNPETLAPTALRLTAEVEARNPSAAIIPRLWYQTQ